MKNSPAYGVIVSIPIGFVLWLVVFWCLLG